MMKILALDTSTSSYTVALMEGTQALTCLEADCREEPSKNIISTIHQVLQDRQVALSDLDGLAVAIGPGSFTGLRVGLATMLGLRTVLQKPLATVSSLEAMVWGYSLETTPLCPMIKGRPGEVYWGVYQWKEGRVLNLVNERAGSFRDAVDSLTQRTLCFGGGWEACRDSLVESLPDHICEVSKSSKSPLAINVGLAGLARLTVGEVAPVGVAPRYVQRAEAEVMWEKRNMNHQVSHQVSRNVRESPSLQE